MTEAALFPKKTYEMPLIRSVALAGEENFLASGDGFSDEIGAPSFDDEDW